MAELFRPLTLRGLTFPNRAWVAAMCQYSAVDGVPNDWHLVHLGSRAVGGAGLILTEATAVSPEGRISPADTGLWNDEQVDAWRRITDFARSAGVPIGVQLAHAGRKASTEPPWVSGRSVAADGGGWQPVAPSTLAFGELPAPLALDDAGLANVRDDFAAATRRALEAGFDTVEVHAAHGYLLHQFLSPLSNVRTDRYGGSLDARMRFPLELIALVREQWPQDRPLLLRVSATDWVAGGWSLDDTIVFAQAAADLGVDLVDTSTGGLVPSAPIPVGPGYQVPFAAAIREKTGLPTGAVGLITEPEQAERVLTSGAADAVLLARAQLRDPYWPRHAADALGVQLPWPSQYERAALPRRS